MDLIEFRITDFRSINDSGPVKVGKLTSLVGRNESGKTNVLLALWTLNPAGGIKDLNPIKDFPRHRRLSECTDDTRAVSTVWELDPTEQDQLAGMFPRAAGVTHVEIGRHYKATHWVAFQNLKELSFSLPDVAGRVRKITPVVEAEAAKLEEALQQQARAAIAKLAHLIHRTSRPLYHYVSTTITCMPRLRHA